MTSDFRRLRPLFMTFSFFVLVFAATVHASQEDVGWVAQSDGNAELLIEILGKFSPELSSQLGREDFDEEILQLPKDYNERYVRALEDALVVLRNRLAAESHPAVRQDLAILIRAAEENIEETRVNEKHLLPYFDLHELMFLGVSSLLDEDVPPERRAAVMVRLRRYTGLEEGYTPLVDQAEAFLRHALEETALPGPYRGELDKDLANGPRFLAGIKGLLETFGVSGHEQAYGLLEEQLAGYEEFLRNELVPRARDDFRLPAEVYASNLESFGIETPIEELASRAKVSFKEIQNEMQALASLIAEERSLSSSDYRDVIRELKKDQLKGEAILPHYRQRIQELERLIEQAQVVTLPEREMSFRFATEAESARTPAPHVRIPQLLGRAPESIDFLLPLRVPGEDGTEELAFDDFTYAAASWTLTVHEGRPGHELQLASVMEKGVSKARALFALNSVNVEGWALYAEAEMKPLLPLDGQLVSLQHRLLRAARAFLDPGLQRGTLSKEEAFRVLEEDVVLSHPMALQEVERYTFWGPGQAPSYFEGYTRLLEMRVEAELALADRFDRKEFHDFVLGQGLLPLSLLHEAVMEDFVEPRRRDL